MSPNEFAHWVQGYIEAGGNDAEVIAAKARTITVEPLRSLYPYPAPTVPTPQWWVVTSGGTARQEAMKCTVLL